MTQACKDVFDLGAFAGNTPVAPPLAIAQGLVLLRLALYAVFEAQRFEHFASLSARVGFVGVDFCCCVGQIEHLIEMLSVMLAGRAGGHLSDEAVFVVNADAELVAKIALAVLFGVSGIHVLLPALGLAPAFRLLALIELRLVFFAQVLLGGRHQGGINGLSASGDVAMAVQLCIHALEQGHCSINTQALSKAPDGVSVGHVHALLQQAKALVAHAIEQLVLHLLIRQVVQAFQDQHTHHDLDWIGGSAAFAAIAASKKWLGQIGQGCKVDVPGDALQGIAQVFKLALSTGLGKQVELQGAARSDHDEQFTRSKVQMGF